MPMVGPKRRDRLMDQIRDLAQSLGVEQDLGRCGRC